MRKTCFAWIWLVAIVAGGITTACTEPIDLRNDGMESKLVITCILTDTVILENFHKVVAENYVTIQKTTPFFGNIFMENVADAKVWLNSKLMEVVGPGVYTLQNFLPVPGETYTLDVFYDLNGDGVDEQFTATATMPQKCHLDSLSLWRPFNIGDYFANLVLHIRGASGENYFGAKLNNDNDSRFFSTRILRYSLFRFDIFSNEDEKKRLESDWWISKEMSYDNENKYYIFAGDTLAVTLESLSKEYHRFLEVAKMELSQNSPLFSGPRSNVPSNFTGGALGIFGAYTASRATIEVPRDVGLPTRTGE